MKTNMKSNRICVHLCLSVVSFILLLLSSSVFAQNKPLIKRTTYKNENIKFGAGGTISIVGAPVGSITVEGWRKNEIEIQADIEVEADNESDLALLAQIDGFVLDEDFGHVRVISVGTHDRDYLKRVAKKFPKRLLDKPFKINYRLKVPVYSDLEINGGRGDLKLAGVEGAMQIRVLDGNGEFSLTGGSLNAVFGGGNVNVKINSRSWRGRSVDFQVAAGTLNVLLPVNMNADIDAAVLRTGKIENSVDALKPRDKAKFTERAMTARVGSGGATFGFTVGDGTLKIGNW